MRSEQLAESLQSAREVLKPPYVDCRVQIGLSWLIAAIKVLIFIRVSAISPILLRPCSFVNDCPCVTLSAQRAYLGEIENAKNDVYRF